MATTQQALDAKYQVLIAEQEQKLKEIFSPDLVRFLRQQGLNTYEEFVNFAGGIALGGIFSLKGINFLDKLSTINFNSTDFEGEEIDLTPLSSLTEIALRSCNLGAIGNLSQNTSLTKIEIDNNPLITEIGYLDKLTSLTRVNLNGCTSLKRIGRIETLGNLEVFAARDTQIGDNLTPATVSILGVINNMTALVSFDIQNSNYGRAVMTASDLACYGLTSFDVKDSALLSAGSIDNYLLRLANLADYQNANGGVLLSTVDLRGTIAPTNGISDTNFARLDAYGINVQIDTV